MSVNPAMPVADLSTLIWGGAGGGSPADLANPVLGLDDCRDLLEHLSEITDPRGRRGVRHAFVSILAIAVAAVLGGARSFTAIGQWADEAPGQVLTALGVRSRRNGQLVRPCESTIRKTLNKTNDKQVMAALGSWPAARATPAMRAVDRKTNEITQAVPLLSNLDLDHLDGTVVLTAAALHTQRKLAAFVVETKGWHYLLPVAGNQPLLFTHLDALARKDVPIAHTQTGRGNGRIEKRTIQMPPAPENITFPHVAQVFLIEREVYDLEGKLTSAIAALGITSLTADQVTAAQLATLVRSHWSIETSHYVRDVSYGEGAGTIRTGTGPAVMAALRSFAIGALHLAGFPNIAAGQRWSHSDYANPLSLNPPSVIR
ncbi:putative transposase YbfD/YdcC [Streptosporangium album]|uniref:Putative transposase YbfD/YdcC n=1 Tax=Streptosporangium album TaxID=47479 RepID=A0A7W7RPH4_9ACTN|nr:ISAs1 family transposase [Streptosporangium album]MBB4935765.1 putative transposase YbfD/YdcC [Streptosporangium album]